MKTIAEILAQTANQIKQGKIKGPNSERIEVIERLISFMGEDRDTPNETEDQKRKKVNERIKYWLGRTRYFTPGAIDGLIKQAKTGHTPPKLFNWLLKKENEKRKNEKK